MVALVIVLAVVVLLMAVLVAGLLRSHADILKALHELGVGVGDPAGSVDRGHVRQDGARSGGNDPVRIPLTMGAPLPGERSSDSAPSLAGATPTGDAVAISVGGGDHLTLLAFLSSGCSTCAGFWHAFQSPDQLGLPARTRLVVVTKGPELEIPAEVRSRAPAGVVVVMSTEAWSDYEVPGSPFFVLVDGTSGRRIGEGVANQMAQVADLVRRADIDARASTGGSRSRAFAEGLDGPERERANDRELISAGILPGDPSLYPSSLDDLHGRNATGKRRRRADDSPTGDQAAPVAKAG